MGSISPRASVSVPFRGLGSEKLNVAKPVTRAEKAA